MATLAQIKSELGIANLELVTALDKQGNKTEWFRHWDNDRRIAVSIPKDLALKLSKDPSINNLFLQSEQRIGEQGPYSAYRIVSYTQESELTL